MDKIAITGLEVDAVIGVLPEERIKKQLLVIDIVLFLDLEGAGRSDEIMNTVDYKQVSSEVRNIIEQGCFQLIEAAARSAAFHCLSYENVREVTITVKKPGAFPGTAVASCEVHRVK